MKPFQFGLQFPFRFRSPLIRGFRLRSQIICGVGVAGLIGLGGCATKPPPVAVENTERRIEVAEPSIPAVKPVTIQESTVIIDARPAYQYSLAHIPNSLNMQWTDFTRQDPKARGMLQTDLFAHTRRLARMGIGPSTHVVVVGGGLEGAGEEWRLAWTLRYLGVENAVAVPLAYFKGHLNRLPPRPRPSVPSWKPETEDAFLATRQEVLAVLVKGGVKHPTTPPGRPQANPRPYKILDVRSPREYLGKEGSGSQGGIPNMDAINIEWREFFNAQGRPEAGIVAKLKAVGITPDHRIIVISDKGVRSAAVTLALKELGFVDVGNYAAGLLDLVRSL